MHINMAFACDAAKQYDNKLSVLGCFDSIKSAELPVIKSECFYVIQITWNKNDQGKHTIKAVFSYETKSKVLKDFTSPVDIKVPDGYSSVSTTHLIKFQDLKFNEYGNYIAQVYVDDKYLSEISVQIIKETLDQYTSFFIHDN